MLLKRTKTVHPANPKNQYHVIGNFMSGDADAYHEETIGVFGHAEERRVKQLVIEFHIARNQYEIVYEDLDFMYTDLKGPFAWLRDIPGDVTYEGRQASLDGITIKYYDEHGVEHDVKYELEQEDKENIAGYSYWDREQYRSWEEERRKNRGW